jgi:hypothetical protein
MRIGIQHQYPGGMTENNAAFQRWDSRVRGSRTAARRSRKPKIRSPKSETNPNSWEWPNGKTGSRHVASRAATNIGYCRAARQSRDQRPEGLFDAGQFLKRVKYLQPRPSEISVIARYGTPNCQPAGQRGLAAVAPEWCSGASRRRKATEGLCSVPSVNSCLISKNQMNKPESKL